ncbi:MAG: hypothetical protein HY908_31255 [Myxococcales bacterium]|nr:hypothetical protein [Myxococcales bacterium]
MRVTLPTGVVAAGAVLVALAACASETDGAGGQGGASSTSSTGTGGGASATELWCDAVGGPFCEALFACCADAGLLAAYGGDVAACKAQWLAECPARVSEIAPLVAAGTSAPDPTQLDACVADLTALAAGGAACVEPPRFVYHMTCVSAFRGQVPAGSPCVTTPDDISFVECAHGLCVNGTCTALGAETEACNPDGAPCDYTAGLWCSYDGVTASCAPRADVGEPCLPAGGLSLACKSLTCGANGLCAAPDGDSVLCAAAN